MNACPLCRWPLERAGRYIAGQDHDHRHFVFAICRPCTRRLDRLPIPIQRRQLEAAVHRLVAYPDRYPFRVMASDIEALRLLAWAEKPPIPLE